MMSRTEGFLILDSQNAATTTEAKKVAKSHPQSAVRMKLADISNLPQNQRPLIQDNKPQSIETTTKQHIDQLQKENMALMKMLAQRNKIIEQRGTELDRLKVNLLRMHDQNQQLALSNSQMLSELNSGKDRLKLLQHELGCKSGLLNARKLELEEKTRTSLCKNADAKSITSLEEGEPSKEVKVDEEPESTKRSLQSNTMDSSDQVLSKETTGNKRAFVRRQSARLKAAELKPAEDFFQTDELKVSEQGSVSENPLSKNDDNKNSCGLRHEYQEFERSSLCRPSRLAAKKVQSYREIPINVKMRRPV